MRGEGWVALAQGPCPPRRSRRGKRWYGSCVGYGVVTEYAVLLGACAIVIATALAAIGPPLVASYEGSRHTLMAPTP